MNKMKYIYAVLFTVVITTVGCTSEIANDCPLFDNLVLNFRYQDDSGRDIFRDNIDLVDVLIFTEEGYYYDWKTVSKSALEEFQGTILALDPGNYLVVCWGNASQNTLTPGSSPLQNYCIVNRGTTEGSPIHYAPRKSYSPTRNQDYAIYTVNAPGKGITETTYDFMAAYWRINVYVSGYENTQGGNEMPQIQVTNLREGYDFTLSPLSDYIDYEIGASTLNTTEGQWAYAGFYTTYFTPQEDIHINVRNKTTGIVAGTVNLNRFLDENNRTLSYGKAEVIDVLVKFTNMGVEVSVPNWDTIGVVPDL